MSNDPARERGIQVTIKYDKGYDATWVSFSGTPGQVRQDIIEFFGLDAHQGMSLSSVVVNATQVAHGKGAIASQLGGTVIAEGPSNQVATQPQARDDDPWAAVQTQPQEDDSAKRALIEQIEKAPSRDALKRIWAENQAAFADDDVKAAYKARGKALPA